MITKAGSVPRLVEVANSAARVIIPIAMAHQSNKRQKEAHPEYFWMGRLALPSENVLQPELDLA